VKINTHLLEEILAPNVENPLKKEGQTLVGFALETNDEESNAQAKLKKKNFDFIVLNSLKDEGAGFRTDTNKITIIDHFGSNAYPLKPKTQCAKDIVDKLLITAKNKLKTK